MLAIVTPLALVHGVVVVQAQSPPPFDALPVTTAALVVVERPTGGVGATDDAVVTAERVVTDGVSAGGGERLRARL